MTETDAWDRAAALYPQLADWLGGEALAGVSVIGGTGTRRHGHPAAWPPAGSRAYSSATSCAGRARTTR
ncbi:hypothetical protein [Streptomyces adelaidensis]|uniref:hypothetical protein n=1 Tax=Streptomyces adelaidensis TaxID=2796465 RepID=UPI00190501B8|nr:hypothetical protein [Streptomyces adelaidensis]